VLKLRLTIISHACVVDVNQGVFAALAGLGHDVAIVTPDRWRHEYSNTPILPQRLDGFSGAFISVPAFGVGSVPLHGYFGRLRPILHTLTPNAVYIQEEPYSVAALQWARVCRTARVPFAFYSAQNGERRYPLPFRLLEHSVERDARVGIAVSDEAVSSLRKRGYMGPVEVVPLAVDASRFRPGSGDEALRKRLRLNGLTVGFLGRLVPEKGVAVLLEALEILRTQLPVKLLCIASGPLASECRKADGVVVAEGVKHMDVPRYLGLVDVLAIPSRTTPRWKEQFGRAIIEALACGIPVVGSDSGSIPEIIGKTGGGVVVPEGDAISLATQLRRILEDVSLRQRLGIAGREAVVNGYSTAPVAARLEEIFREIALS
jgi:glycosyltransferase involved in cell wall biosynthesis